MADLTVTAANVIVGKDSVILTGTAGETITAGQPVYKDPADADSLKRCSTANATTANAVGVALANASDGQPLSYQSQGEIDPGATVTVGELYLVSNTAGGIAPEADIGSGKYVSFLGIGTATNKVKLRILASGITIP